MLNSTYHTHIHLVNRELRHFLRFSALISKVYNIFIKLYINSMVMNACVRSLEEHLSRLGLTTSIKYTYLKLFLDNGAFSKFYIFKPELSQALNITTRQVERQLSVLEEQGLFARTYQKSSEIKKSGLALYGKLTPPLHLIYQNSPLIFQARFKSIGTGKGHHERLKYAWVYDIYNEDHDLEARLQYIGMLTEEEIKLFESLEKGDYILFDAEIESFDEQDPQKIKILNRPTNIRSAYQ